MTVRNFHRYNPSFHNRFDIVIIVFDYEGKPSNQRKTANHKQEEAEGYSKNIRPSFKTADEPIVVSRKMMNH